MPRILIADDEKDIRDLIAITLRFAGHDVTVTSDGQEASEIARALQPDLILLDVRMPRMSGHDACRKMKADKSTRHIPVVFLSAKDQEAEIQAGLDAGADDYIVKPFAPDQLADRIQSILEKIGKV